MSVYIFDWLNLVLRWAHVITGVAWIGASFYFIWLDNSLEEPSDDNKEKGIGGQLSAIHGGGFYEVGKYALAPQVLPSNLHWFKWEAYSTFITGFLLFVLMFYVGAESYLIDSSKMQHSVPQAIGISLFVFIGGWLVYDQLCKTALAKNGWLLAAILLMLVALLTWVLGEIFSSRAAFMQIGALIGTCMTANVFFVIMPGQRALVKAVEQEQQPEAHYAKASKLRSVHNNYLTLPVIFLMISNHYPMTYNHHQAWLVLLAILLIGAWTRHFFNLKHKGIVKPSILITAAIAIALLAWMISPKPQIIASSTESQENSDIHSANATNEKITAVEAISTDQIVTIMQQRCASCHGAAPTDDLFKVAPAGVLLENETQVKQWASRIYARSVISKDMPFMNKTKMTNEERQAIAQWFKAL